MNKISRFENLIIWQQSQELAISLITMYKDSKNFYFRDQISRAALSVSNNIAEGYERDSTKEYIRFLYIAKASCGEVRSMLYIADKLDPELSEIFKNLIQKCNSISKMIMAIIKKLKSRID